MGSIVVEFLITKIITVLENEASFLGGVRDELDEIKLELISMKSFLVEADRKGVYGEGEKTWVQNVRDIAYDVEDVIDEFLYHMDKERSKGRLAKFFNQSISAPKKLLVRHRLAGKLQTINRRIKAIPERRQRYGVGYLEGTNAQNDRNWVKIHSESSHFIEDIDLIGIDEVKEKLVGWLLNDEPQRTIISVFGMGGSGKTTLAAKTYDNQVVKRCFDCHAWITVSQSYEIEELFRIMIKEFYGTAKEEAPIALNNMSYRQLVEILVNYLQRKRYLIILDDVWNINLWREINVALPDGTQRSRCMLTTRNEDIACFSFGCKTHVHHLQPLKKSEAWYLFCIKAFSSNPDRSCPPELETLAHDLAEKCDGLPLAIVALGGLMSSKKLEYAEWKKVFNSLNWELSNNPRLEVVRSILYLSFNDLPYQLKHCFLYCCIFPENYKIYRKRLVRLWIAEGFVEQIGGLTPEEVAESYFAELIFRSMLQVVTKDSSGMPQICKMHHLLRELALSISRREKFCAVYDAQQAAEELGARRLSIQASEGELRSGKDMPKLRSFFVFVSDKVSSSYLNLLVSGSGSKLLRILDLQAAPINKLPNGLVKLYNLRYLNLSGSQVKHLPRSIGKLQQLRTLDISETQIEVLPTEIVTLQNLRHLYMYRLNRKHNNPFAFIHGIPVNSSICNLKNLQVLSSVEAQGHFIKHLACVTQLKLKEFGITNVQESDGNDLCKSIENMKLLSILYIMAINEEEPLRLNTLSSPPPCLKKLSIFGKMETIPPWFSSLHSVTYLNLRWSRFSENILPHIQYLPNLVELCLRKAYEGNQLDFHTGFQKLTHLSIIGFPELEQILIEKGVMPSAKRIKIENCMKLKSLPEGIEHLRGLQELELTDVPIEVVGRIRGERNVERSRVRHIPNITHYHGLGGSSQISMKWTISTWESADPLKDQSHARA